jgi:hypothetical protein
MTKATRVYSTPPTSTPIDTTRRHLLTIAAGGAVAAAIPTAVLAGAAASDPAFDLIAEKRAADVAHCEAIDADCEFDERGDYSSDAAIEAQENSEAACHYVHEVDWKLATTPPTTTS